MQPEQLGPYRIVRSLGQGGMGAVYEGVHEETGERAAVKVLAASLASHEGFRQRFEAEIETLKMLRHPNVVRLFGFGEQDGTLFYIMEMVEGESLEKQIRDHRQFRWPEVVEIAIEMCQALRHAHDRGIIHRDIKPANILLTESDQVRIVDFGIARLFGNTGMTVAGSVLGTVEYMAPEQADGRPVGIRADLYSLGGVIYTMLAGRPPFLASTIPEMLHKQRNVIPAPVREYSPSVPKPLEQIVARLLEKRPEDRFATADAIRRRLEDVRNDFSESDALDGVTMVGTPSSADEDGDDFDLAGATGAGGSADPEAGGEFDLQQTIDTDRLQTPDDVQPETKMTEALHGLPEAESVPEKSTTASGVGTTRFTMVDEQDLDAYVPEEEHPAVALISVQTWMLAAALLIVGFGTWYMLRPPTADDLYAEIREGVSEGTIASYRRMEDEILEFETRFSDDPRCVELEEILNEIDLASLEQDFQRRSGRLDSQGSALPIVRVYQDAVNYAKLDPEIGIAKFRALVDLYGREEGSGEVASGLTAQCVELARRRLERIQQQLTRMETEGLAEIHLRLDQADAIADTDPERAKRMRQAVVELYEHKPWAAGAVERARAALTPQP